MSDPTLTIETRGHVLVVGLSRAAKRNAFNLQMLRELAAAYGRLESDPELRCLVLFAHGDHFTAGLDLAEVGPHVAGGGGLHVDGGIDPLDLSGTRRAKPVVMAVQGYCYTIGVELALAADVVVASRDARFTQFEVRRGIMPFGGATLRFAQVAGYQNAMRYMLTGDVFDADEACRIGVVQEVTDPGQQVERAIAIGTTIAQQAPLAVQATRANAKLAVEQGHAAAYARLMTEARAHGERRRRGGLRSFVERRDARFQGR